MKRRMSVTIGLVAAVFASVWASTGGASATARHQTVVPARTQFSTPEAYLAVGVQWEDVGSILDAGAVNVIYGSSTDLNATRKQFWNQDSTGILDQAEIGDVFGWGLGEPGTGGPSTPRTRPILPWLPRSS